MFKKKDRYTVAVIGATGAVGREMVSILEERKFPMAELRLFASHQSAGSSLEFEGNDVKVRLLDRQAFTGVDIALFSAGEEVSREYAPVAVGAGTVVIDNSAAWRMEADVPLVVPEVNRHAIGRHRGIIANPNCSTIQMVVVLKPLHDAVRIERVVVSTYQSVSGTGREAMDELMDETRALLNFQEVQPRVYPYQIAFNCLPQIGSFDEQGDCTEEIKMIRETHKIMEDDSIRVSATTVRVPVFHSHSESVNIETERKITPNEARAILSTAPGVLVYDDPQRRLYPMPIASAGQDAVYVGRIREDRSIPNGLNLWIVADNLRKGAALNAIQIAEELIGTAHP
jgi:aspartate-semialdehyde dehydrogenase